MVFNTDIHTMYCGSVKFADDGENELYERGFPYDICQLMVTHIIPNRVIGGEKKNGEK